MLTIMFMNVSFDAEIFKIILSTSQKSRRSYKIQGIPHGLYNILIDLHRCRWILVFYDL